MRICVVGAGAIGGFMGAQLAFGGHAVTMIARGTNLRAIRQHGLRLRMNGGEVAATVEATEDMREPGPQDVVILALKAHQLEDVAASVGALLGPETIIVTVQNGIPWWYFQKHGGPLDGRRLESLDPDGVLERHIPTDRLIGSIAYPATERPEPGVIQHIEGNRFPVGELDGSKTERVRAIAEAFNGAGLKSRVLTDIRAHIWLKAWGNLSFNPISVLTRASLAEMCRFPDTRALVETMMGEAQQVAERLGIMFRITIDQRIAGAEAVGEHKTSMLQDFEAGRALEVEALVGSVIELGRLTEVPTPSITAIYACVKLLTQS
jgi:2-dehydropantoate 2-reductase